MDMLVLGAGVYIEGGIVLLILLILVLALIFRKPPPPREAQVRMKFCAASLRGIPQDMAALPENLAELEAAELRKVARVRDERIEPLFRRWPRLTKKELAELARLYRERMRVAKHVARRRRASGLE